MGYIIEDDGWRIPDFMWEEMEQIIPGRMDREAKKLLQRLNTAWVYCKDNVSKEIGISIRDLEVIQGIIVSEGELGVRIADVVFDIPPSHK